MAYYCKDCSYRGVKSGQLGECPACGSYNIVKRSQTPKEELPSGKWRLVVLGVLWSYLTVMIIWKLIQ